MPPSDRTPEPLSREGMTDPAHDVLDELAEFRAEARELEEEAPYELLDALEAEVKRLRAVVASGERVIAHVRGLTEERRRLSGAMMEADGVLEDCHEHSEECTCGTRKAQEILHAALVERRV